MPDDWGLAVEATGYHLTLLSVDPGRWCPLCDDLTAVAVTFTVDDSTGGPIGAAQVVEVCPRSHPVDDPPTVE